MGCQPDCPEFINPELRDACTGIREIVVDDAGEMKRKYACGVIIMKLLQDNP